MRRIGGLWESLVSFDNLHLAWRKARLGKANRPAVARFALDLEHNLLRLQQQLIDRTYQPDGYRLFTIYDRKPRNIAAAPFHDRVVHHALMNRIEPVLDRRLYAHSYACRIGKGVHAAVDRYQRWAQRYPFALKLDVSRYFPSIDHQILKRKLRHHIKDQAVLWLFDRIIDSAPLGNAPLINFPGDDLVDLMQRRRGLPIGNLTSQFLGNLYLTELDYFLKQQCGVRAYLRYVDDLILLDDSKARLWWINSSIEGFLQQERLILHPNKVQVLPTAKGVDLLGYRVFPHYRRLRRENGYRFRRRLRAQARAYSCGELELADVRASVAAWIGHVRHADSEGLRRSILGVISFSRGAAPTRGLACGSRRRLEQQTGEPPVGQPQQEHRR
jgi:hypothetical protein